MSSFLWEIEALMLSLYGIISKFFSLQKMHCLGWVSNSDPKKLFLTQSGLSSSELTPAPASDVSYSALIYSYQLKLVDFLSRSFEHWAQELKKNERWAYNKDKLINKSWIARVIVTSVNWVIKSPLKFYIKAYSMLLPPFASLKLVQLISVSTRKKVSLCLIVFHYPIR